MIPAPPNPRWPRPPRPWQLAMLAGLGAGTWLLSLVSQGVAAFVTAVIVVVVGGGLGVAVGVPIGELRGLEQIDRLNEAYDDLYERARESQVAQHEAARRLGRAEHDLRHREAEVVALRAHLEAATVEEG
ncbi:hypothetical protein AB0J43_02720 [Nonomuraea fuscirosea]